MWPPQYITYAEEHPDLHIAAAKVASDYSEATKAIGNKTMVVFACYKIIEAWGEDVCDEFMQEVFADSKDEEVSQVVELFWSTLQKDKKKTTGRMKKHILLGVLINTFNAWIRKETPKSVAPKNPGAFPHFATPETNGYAPENGEDEELEATESETELEASEPETEELEELEEELHVPEGAMERAVMNRPQE